MKIKRAGIITKIVIAILLVYAATTLTGLYSQINEANNELANVRDAVDELNAKNAELEYAVNNSDDPEVIEDIARDLGLAYPNEEVFVLD